MKRLVMTLMIAAAGLCPLAAQTESPDSVSVPVHDAASDGAGTLSPDSVLSSASFLRPVLPVLPERDVRLWLDPERNYAPVHHYYYGITPGVAPLAGWGTGMAYASGGRTSMPGLMGIETGSLALVQRFGRLTLNAGANATKYGYFRGLTSTWGFSASMTYAFSSRLSLTVFGSWQSEFNGPMTPAMAGYVSLPTVGGYLDWQFADHFGVKVGAQAYRVTNTGNWQAQPIVIPYYKFDNGATIGVDVGGMIYNMIRSKSGYRENPTFGPPVNMGPPPVGPRN